MQVRLLALVLLQADREWTLEGLAKHLQAPPSSVHRELRRLMEAGLVSRESRHRPHTYQAAREAPAYAPLRKLLELTAGVPERLAAELARVPGVLVASVHGSWASGRIRPDSDIDVIVVTNGDRRAVQKALRRIAQEVDREVDASVLSTQSYDELMQSRNPFLGKILNGPRIDVVGNLADLGQPL